MRRRELLFAAGGVSPAEAAPMSVVFERKTSPYDLLIVESETNWAAQAPPSSWTPIGIVVIPASHGVLKDGTGTVNQCGVMSIVPMDYRNPETGNASSEVPMYWGGYGTDISGKSDGLGRYDSTTNGLTNYNKVVVTADNTSNTASGLSSSYYAYIPRQGSVGSTPTRNNSPYAPSPYAGSDYKSGGYNTSYGTTSFDTSSNKNALADFSGIVNTKIITDLAVFQSDWKTASTITNNSGAGYYPAVCCCARYHTNGTKAFKDCTTSELKSGSGFWYMPSCGEIGYMPPKLFDINDTISKLSSSYSVGVQLGTSSSFWSSSGYSSGSARYVYSGYGLVNGSNKLSTFRSRAFLRL